MTKPNTAPAEGSIEHRVFPFGHVQLRDNAKTPRMVGHAAVFNSLSEDLGGFRETIRPGTFAKTIRESDVYALFNHDANMPLANSASGRLFLAEDKRGLSVEITPTDTTYARDLLTNMNEGVINKMSFGFETVKDEWRGSGKEVIRELREVRLYDVSPVTFPAYRETDIQARSLLTKAGLEFDELGSAVFKRNNGVPLTLSDRDLIKRSISLLNGFLTPEPVRTNHSEKIGVSSGHLPGITRLRERLEAATRN